MFREEPCWTVQHEAVTATWKTQRIVVCEAAKVTWRIWKSRADSAAWSRESYKKSLKKTHDDSAAQSCESYLKDPEKGRARNRESYMKDPEKSHADSAAQSRKRYKKDLKKSRWNETGMDISYKSKKTAAAQQA